MIQVSLPLMSLSPTILPEAYYANVNNVLFLFKFSVEKSTRIRTIFAEY